MCTMVIILYNFDEKMSLTKKNSFLRKKMVKEYCTFLDFFLDLPKLKRNKKVTAFEVLFLVEIF